MATKTSKKETKVQIKLQDMTVPELMEKVKQLKTSAQKIKLERIVSKSRNVREVYNLRKQLARTKTVLNMKMTLNKVKS